MSDNSNDGLDEATKDPPGVDEELVFSLLQSARGPTPRWVRERAMVAWEWRDPDAALAELIGDSRHAVGVRSVSTHEYVLTYRAGTVEIVVTVRKRTDSVDTIEVGVERDLVPVAAEVMVIGSAQPERQIIGSVQLDDQNESAQFEVSSDRLIQVVAEVAGARIATEWFYSADAPKSD